MLPHISMPPLRVEGAVLRISTRKPGLNSLGSVIHVV